MTRGFFFSFGLRIETRVLVRGDGAVGLFFEACRLAMTLCLRAWIRPEASLLQGAATQGRDEVGLTGLLMAMAAIEEAKDAMLVDGRARWAAGIY